MANINSTSKILLELITVHNSEFSKSVENVTDFSSIANTSYTANNSIESKIIIPLYAGIFILAVVGNTMVLFTLFQNKCMRTVTNVYLVNLALSDLLLGVWCMPFTLIGQVLRNFIFGSFMCKLIPYSQVVSVSVAVWTLVAISLERYFAICRPLKSRRWQTEFHAYKMICFVWVSSLLWSSPVLLVSTLTAIRQKGTFKCRELWSNMSEERIYNIFLDIVLLVIPLFIMILAYSLIVKKLWKGLRKEIQHSNSFQQRKANYVAVARNENHVEMRDIHQQPQQHQRQHQHNEQVKPNRLIATEVKLINSGTSYNNVHSLRFWLQNGFKQGVPTAKGENNSLSCRLPIRSNYMDKSIGAKRKVIRMLFVIVLEFFVCWAPLHILNTLYLYYPDGVYAVVGPTGISLVQLLAFISSCCNPITYCFMNKKFRQSFLAMICAYKSCYTNGESFDTPSRRTIDKKSTNKMFRTSEGSFNESAYVVGRASTFGRSG